MRKRQPRAGIEEKEEVQPEYNVFLIAFDEEKGEYIVSYLDEQWARLKYGALIGLLHKILLCILVDMVNRLQPYKANNLFRKPNLPPSLQTKLVRDDWKQITLPQLYARVTTQPADARITGWLYGFYTAAFTVAGISPYRQMSAGLETLVQQQMAPFLAQHFIKH